jgi:fructose-specific component phosphotransferase system IIB-like protein
MLLVMASAGFLFILLFMPAQLQSAKTIERLQRTGKPMNRHWFDNSICLAITGTPWHREDLENTTEVPMRERINHHLFSARVGIIGDVCLIGLGLLLLVKKRPAMAISFVGMLVFAAAGAAYFKWGMHIEWITWYFFPVILPLIFFKATAMDDLISISAAWVNRLKGSPKMRTLACATALLAMLAPIASAQNAVPQILLMLKQPYESHREAFGISRGQHEKLGYTGPSKVWTVYTWRHINTYDSRADIHCLSAAALKAKMAKVDATPEGELYVVVGQRVLTKALSPDMMQLVHDTKLFTKIETFWAEESIHTLEVYKYLHTHSANH